MEFIMNKEELKNRIDTRVPIYIKANSNIDFGIDHVIEIGKSILYDYHEIINGGGFVKSFNGNDLEATFAKADMIIKVELQKVRYKFYIKYK